VEAAEQSLARLVEALERLVAQEAVQAVAGDHAGVLATQGRAAPIVRRLAELGHEATTPSTRLRLNRVAERRRQTQQFLASRITSVRAELDRNRIFRNRLRKVAPAYLSRQPAAGRLLAVT
jgi:hypothetical protein